MEIQYYGANCLSFTTKGTRIVIDDNLAELGAKSIVKSDDVVLCTEDCASTKSRLTFSSPGEYEVADISIVGIPARSHVEEDSKKLHRTMFKLVAGEQSMLIVGHIYPALSEGQLEKIGPIDIMFVPVGGNGYTVDPTGALQLIKSIEPKVVVPTHYSDKSMNYPVPQQELATALNEMAMEPKETVSKIKLKASELTDNTQLIILEKV